MTPSDKRMKNLKPWPKGVSGNPTGQDNNRKSIDTIVREFLEKKSEAKINGKLQEVRNLDLMMEAQLRQSIQKQDTRAFQALLDRAYGKAKETIEIGNKEGETFRTEDSSILAHAFMTRPELFNQGGQKNGNNPRAKNPSKGSGGTTDEN